MSVPVLAGDAVARHGGSGRLTPGARRPQTRLERVWAAIGYHHRVYLRTWRGTLIGRFASPLFFLAAMGLGLGGLVDDQVGGIDGVPYLQYVAAGILAMQAMWLAFGESTYPVMTYIRWNQMYAGMLATPLSVVEVLLGHLAYVAFHLATTTAIFVVVGAFFGAFTSPWVLLAIPISVLLGLAFAVPMFAFSAHIDNDNAFALVFRFLVTPVMLFSGVFFPDRPAARPPPADGVGAAALARGRARARGVRGPGPDRRRPRARRRPRGLRGCGLGPRPPLLREATGLVSALDAAARVSRALPLPGALARSWFVVGRNITAFRRAWLLLVSGVAEPVFYLFSIGVGIGALVQTVTTDGGHEVPYAVFVAPALLAAAAMNGAIADSTYNVFFKLKHARLYDAILATPAGPRDIAVGEITWSLMRGSLYSALFLVVAVLAGFVQSWWAVLALPGAVLIGLAFGAIGMFATTYMKTWQHFEYINLAIQPMFLFSATFFPLSTYPPALQWLVQLTPLYQGVALERGLMLGEVGWSLLGNAAYLVVLGAIGIVGASRRIERLLLT